MIRSNPFATRFVQAGVIPFVSRREKHYKVVVDRFEQQNWRGQIVGPHGSGKTSLARSLVPALSRHFSDIQFLTIRTHRRISFLPSMSELHVKTNERIGGKMIIVDGLENLPFLHRCLMIRACTDRQIGLLATVHRKIRALPLIAEQRVDLDTFVRLCRWLQRDYVMQLPASVEKEAFYRHRGNMREAFMDLYDRWEAVQRGLRNNDVDRKTSVVFT